MSIKQFETITMSFANRYYDVEWGQFITLDTGNSNQANFYPDTNSSIEMVSPYVIDIESDIEREFNQQLTTTSYMNNESIVSTILDTVIHSVTSFVYFITTLK